MAAAEVQKAPPKMLGKRRNTMKRRSIKYHFSNHPEMKLYEIYNFIATLWQEIASLEMTDMKKKRRSRREHEFK